MHPGEAPRRGAWILLDNVTGAAFSIVFLFITARFLSPIEFGTAAIALSIVQLVGPTVESLFHDAIVQREHLDDRHLQAATVFTIGWAGILFLILSLLAGPLSLVFDAPALASYLPWFGLVLILSGFSAVPAAEARRLLRFRLLAVRTIVARVLATAAGVAMLSMGYGISAVVVQFALSAGISTLLLLTVTGIHWRGVPCGSHLRTMLRFAVPAVGAQFLGAGTSRIAVLIVGAILGPAMAGLWSLGFRLVEPIQALLATTIGQLSLSIFSRQQSLRQRLVRSFLWGTRYTTSALLPVCFGIAACASPILEVFGESKWLAAEPVMIAAAIVAATQLTRQLAETVLTALGHPRLNLGVQCVTSLVTLVGVTIGASFGLTEAAVGWTTRVVPFIWLSGLFVRRQLGLSVLAQLRPVLPPVLGSSFMATVVSVLQMTLIADFSPVFVLIISILFGVVLYSLALAVVDRTMMREVLSFATRLLRK